MKTIKLSWESLFRVFMIMVVVLNATTPVKADDKVLVKEQSLSSDTSLDRSSESQNSLEHAGGITLSEEIKDNVLLNSADPGLYPALPAMQITPPPTPTNTPVPGLILADGFENGDFSAWEWANTDGGDLSITTQAAAVGNYGMQAVLDDGNELIVFDESPNEEDHFSTRFYFHPNSVQAPEGGFYLMSISSEETWGVACLWLDQQGDSYTLGLCGQDDDEDWYESEGVFIANEWQAVELEWKAAATPGANDGYIRLYVGDQLADSIENLDNDTQAVTEVSWGVTGNGFVANGTLYFDAYESRTGAHIGLHPNGPAVNPPPVRPDALFADDFESGDLSRWSPTRTLVDGGDLSVTSSAAYQSGYGLQALIDDTTILQAVDSSPAGEDHYRARFYFDPNSIAMNSGSAHFIFDGVYVHYDASVFRLELLYENGSYKLRPHVMKDDGNYTAGSKYTISDDWHVVEIEWQAASTTGANNGFLSLWIDDTLVGTISNVDNDFANKVDEVRLGATGGVDSSTSGSYYFDNFESRRHSYIGPISGTGTVTPIVTISPTGIMTFTATPSATSPSSPSSTKTSTPTKTPYPSKTPRPSKTPTPSRTVSPTNSNIPLTPSPTKTPSPTNTPLSTPTGTETTTATNTPTFTPSATDTLTFTPSATSTPTFTPTATLPNGIQCFNWREGNSQGWIPSPWMNSQTQIIWDTNGMYGDSNINGTYEVGTYFQMPQSGSYKLVIDASLKNSLTVAQGINAPSTSEELPIQIFQNLDGSYFITDDFVELRWDIENPGELSTTTIFKSFCFAPFVPTTTPTQTKTPTLTPTPNHSPEIISTPIINYHLPINSGSAIVLDAVIRDFNAHNPSDFEATLNAGTNVITGLVDTMLGGDGKPVFVGANGQGYIESPDTFNQWYNDIPGVNQKIILPLTLIETYSGSGIYTYSSSAFFPIDNMLFGNDGLSNNFHFTLETHTTFTYRGGEVFNFTGDDDIWVFINDQLVIDLGSAHPPASASISLDTLGLTIGDTYSFDLFFAERHTYGSNFFIQTSIELEPGQQYTYDVEALDQDNDDLVYSLVTFPPGMAIDPETGVILWNPNSNDLGEHEVVVQVSDGHGGIDAQTYTLSVLVPGTSTPTPTVSPTPTSTEIVCDTWNVAYDFRSFPNQENPNRDSCNNPGVWEFMGSSSLIRDPSNYYILPGFTESTGGRMGVNSWYGTSSDSNGPLPHLDYNDTDVPQTWGSITLPSHLINVHPETNQLVIIAWHSPFTGYVSVTGGVGDNDPGGGDGILWYIDKNSTTLASGEQPNGSAQQFEAGSGGANLDLVAVNSGDTLYFIVHPNGTQLYDSTRIDITIRQVNPLPTNHALHFSPNSVPQLVYFPTSSNLNLGLDMTIEFWIRTNSTYGGGSWHDAQWIIDKDIPGASNPDWAVVLHQGRIGFNGGGLLYSSPVNDGQWHHIAIVRDTGAGLITMYLDGNLDGSQPSTLSDVSNNEPFVLGTEYNSPTSGVVRSLNGDLDDLRVWSIPRNQSDILQDMDDELQGSEVGLAGYWKFNEGTGQVIYDSSQFHINGTLGNTVSVSDDDPSWVNGHEFSGNTTPTPSPTSVGPTSTGPASTPTKTPTIIPTPPDYTEISIPGWIASPVSESSVSGVVPITLADNITLQSGTIMYWPADDRTHVTTLASNVNGSGGSVLASLDATTLANGSYIVMLSGTDSNNNYLNSAVLIMVTGEYKPGRVRFTVNDLTVPVSGLPIVVGRTYDSLNRNISSDFGYGWNLAIANPRLEVDDAHNVTLTMPDGKRTTFYFTPESFGGWFGFMLAPKYTPEAGVYGSLTVPTECGAVIVSGGSYFCFPGSLYDPQEYTYTDPYGRKFVMSKNGTLKTITDLNGNVLTFSPDGITSSMGGVRVDFIRDPLGRITQITGPDNTEYFYDYDTNGNLEIVTLPDNGQQAELRYGYYEDHFFKEAFDPRGNRPVITTYDSAGRMESVTDAAGSKTVYAYDLAARTTTITYLGDPNDPADDLGTSIQVHDEAGYLVSETNPLNQTTTYEYNSAHKLVKVTDPLNHAVQYTYDDSGNPTSIIDPLMNTVGSITYNKYGGPVTITVPGVSNTTIAYDPVTFMPLSAGDNMGPLGGYTWDDHGNPETFTDQNNETTHYTYTAQGYVETATDPLGHVTRYQYDLFGRVTDMTVAYGTSDAVTTHYVYDELGRKAEVTSAYGTSEAATTQYEYDANGNMTAVIDPLLRRTEYEYDSANRLTAVIYAAHAPSESTITEYVYDIYGRLTDTTIAAGTADASTTHYVYDALGRKTDVITAYGTSSASTTHYQYDAAGRTTFVTAAYGTSSASTVHYQYDAVGRMTDMTIAHGTANASTTHYTYYNTGRMESMTTAYGTAFAATTHYDYDARGRASQTTYADGTTTTQDYDPLPNTPGWVQSITDQAGITTEYVYDAAGRLEELITHATDGQTQTQRYEYDAANRLVNSFDALNNRTSFTYYINGQTHTTSSWLNASTSYTTTYTYNPAGEQIAILDAKGHTTSYDYNERGLLEKITFEGGIFTTQAYDAANRLITSTDENGITTRSVYNAASQLTSVTLADGTADEATVQYEYNAAGQLTRMIDAMNHATQYEYNAAGQQKKKILPDLSYEEYGYNAAGNQVSHRLTDGNTNNFTYDVMNRLIEISYFDGQYANFTYTAGGQRDTASTRISGPGIPQVYDYSYDTFGRLTGVEYPDGREITYTYNANNQILTMTSPGGTTSYGYDALSRLTSVNGTTFEYDALGLLTDEHLSNGVTTSYGYDDLNRLTNITQQLGSTLIGSYAYTLDDAGNRLSVNEMGGQSIQWTYDDLYRLKSETRKNGATIVAQSSFTYDLTGNRLSQTVDGVTTNYTYNSLDQMLTAGSVQYEYDGRGNLKKEIDGSQIAQYNYDAANRLASVITPDGMTITNSFDADGRRVKQTVNAQVTTYLWDETSLYGDVVLETTGGVNTSYTLAGTQLISQTRNGSISFYLQDGQGSTRALTNSAGAVTDTYSYTAYGEIYNQTGTTANNYLYTGQQFDQSTGLYSLRARFYNPSWGRFLSQDTWAVNYSNPIELNRYGYTANNPINGMDPSGLFLADYALNAFSKLEAARGFVALGMATGAIYGYVSASLCGGSVAWGIASGAVMGGVSAIGMTLAPAFTAAAGVTASVIGTGMAFNDIAQHGWNACNVMQAFTSLVGIAGGVYGGMSGGSGFSPSLAWAGNNGYVYTMASTAQGGIEGTLSILSLMMSTGGEGENTVNETDNSSQGFTDEELGYIGDALNHKYDNMLNQIECHGASLARLGRVGGINMVPNEAGFLEANTRFKLIGEFKPLDIKSILRPGDLITYHQGSDFPVHSNRFLGWGGGKALFFDKAGLGKPFMVNSFENVISYWSPIKVLIYRP